MYWLWLYFYCCPHPVPVAASNAQDNRSCPFVWRHPRVRPCPVVTCLWQLFARPQPLVSACDKVGDTPTWRVCFRSIQLAKPTCWVFRLHVWLTTATILAPPTCFGCQWHNLSIIIPWDRWKCVERPAQNAPNWLVESLAHQSDWLTCTNTIGKHYLHEDLKVFEDDSLGCYCWHLQMDNSGTSKRSHAPSVSSRLK